MAAHAHPTQQHAHDEDICDVFCICRLHDQLGKNEEPINDNVFFRLQPTHLRSLSFANLDVPLEHLRVHEAQIERGHSHRGGDRTEIEHALVAKHHEVFERVSRVAQRIKYHPALRPPRGVFVAREYQLLDFRGPERAPDLTRPEISPLIDVLAEIADDVRLLEEHAHRVREFRLCSDVCGLLAGCGEQS